MELEGVRLIVDLWIRLVPHQCTVAMEAESIVHAAFHERDEILSLLRDLQAQLTLKTLQGVKDI